MTSSLMASVAQMISESREHAEKHPPQEVLFMQAMQESIPENKRDVLQNAISLFKQFEAMKHLCAKFRHEGTSSISAQSTTNDKEVQGTCVHSDGVYEIDEQCVKSKSRPDNNLFLLLLMIQALK